MSDFNFIAQKVASLISDQIDGDTIHLIDSYMAMALRNVAKWVATNKPTGHEKLLFTQTVTSIEAISVDLWDEYKKIPFSSFAFKFVIPELAFHLVRFNLSAHGGQEFRAYPVGSYEALKLQEDHLVPYYYIEPNYIHIAFNETFIDNDPSNVMNTLEVTHYIYPTISQFPEELEEFLIAELVKLVNMEASKQQTEKFNV